MPKGHGNLPEDTAHAGKDVGLDDKERAQDGQRLRQPGLGEKAVEKAADNLQGMGQTGGLESGREAK